MGKVIRPFCWHQNFVPKGLSTSAPGLYTCGKTFKNMYKIRVERDLFETCNNRWKWYGLSVGIKLLTPKGWLHLFRGYIHVEKTFKNVSKIRIQRNMYETYTKWAKWQGLSVDIKYFPQGVVYSCPGAIYMWKNIKICIKSELKEMFFLTCNKWVEVIRLSVGIKHLTRRSCLLLRRGYIHVEKH